MKPETTTEAYQTDDDHPTLTYCAGDRVIALPYHLIRQMELSENGVEIAVSYDELDVKIRGRHLHRLWRELRAFRVKEISLNGGAASTSLGGAAERCLVESIAFLEVATET